MFLQFTKNLFFPKQCYGCERKDTYICDECFHKYVQINQVHKCHVCGLETAEGLVHEDCQEKTFLDGVVCVGKYGDFLKRIIRDGKYSFVSGVFEDIGLVMSQYAGGTLSNFDDVDDNLVTFVPMHMARKKSRGYDQAEILASSFARNTNTKFTELIVRKRNTKTQVGMGKHEREINLIDAFDINTATDINLVDKNIIIVDDVFTTGTTMNLCAKVLKEAGAKSVVGFSLARSRERVSVFT